MIRRLMTWTKCERKAKRVSFLNERRRGLVEGGDSGEEKSDLSLPVSVTATTRPLPSPTGFSSSSSRSQQAIDSSGNNSLAADTTDDEELSSAASSTPPSPAQSTSSSSSSSAPASVGRELSFFPTEPAIDISGAQSSTLTVKFTYRHSFEDCVQAFWDISQPTGADGPLAGPEHITTCCGFFLCLCCLFGWRRASFAVGAP